VAGSGAVRRASYGPTSPAVGERGARTRGQIVEAALELFAERGVHATVVDDIAGSAGISRAALYQYFESKEAIFLELVEESGAALLRVVRALGPLGPTAAGFDQVRAWLAEMGRVYDRYATVFIQWAAADSPDAPLRPMFARWLEAYTARLAARLAEAPVVGIDPADLAVALWAIIERYSFYRHRVVARPADDAAIANLAVVVQLTMFPATPADVLGRAATRVAFARPVVVGRPRPDDGPDAASSRSEVRFGQLGPQARRTVRLLLDAGGRLFASRGYHGTTIDDVIAEAGVARGTYYKYFADKLDLLVTLSCDASRDIRRMAPPLGQIDDGRALRSWLAGFVALHDTQVGMFRVWLDGVPRQPAVARPGEEAVAALLAAIGRLLGRVDRAYALDEGAAALMLLGLLERGPQQAAATRYARTTAQTVETMALVIERGFLSTGAPPRRPRTGRRSLSPTDRESKRGRA